MQTFSKCWLIFLCSMKLSTRLTIVCEYNCADKDTRRTSYTPEWVT